MTSRHFVSLALVAAGVAGTLFVQQIVPPGAMTPSAFGDAPGQGFGSQPLLVETAHVGRAAVAEELEIVGSLEGASSVEVASKVSGRLRQINVRLGDRVAQGQQIAAVEDEELRQQVSQQEAAFDVARATVRQREADLALAEANRQRLQSLFDQKLLSRQELDDGEARFQAAVAQLDLARAQHDQAQARLEELQINLANTVIVSPVDGFIGRRYLDPGAHVTSNTAVVSVVDTSIVRLVANLVERDLRLVDTGTAARIDVDAYPGESFTGQVARIAPVLDTATRTARLEIEIRNPDFRLKPGMYARVSLAVGSKPEALVVPREAVVLRNNARGVFVVDTERQPWSARFAALSVGFEDDRHVEVLDGVAEGDLVVTTGAAGLQHGDAILPAGADDREPTT